MKFKGTSKNLLVLSLRAPKGRGNLPQTLDAWRLLRRLRLLAMTHKWVYTSLALFLLMVSGNAYAKKVHPTKLYDHQMHTDSFFTPNNVPCETCHINDQYEWKGMNKDGCHNCHKESKWLDYASKDCSRCHAKWPVKPASHKANWLAMHKIEASVSKYSCQTCHNDRFCIKCHEQRGSVKLNVHKRNFRYFHSIEARMDPKKCDRCHLLTFCTACHTNPRGK